MFTRAEKSFPEIERVWLLDSVTAPKAIYIFQTHSSRLFLVHKGSTRGETCFLQGNYDQLRVHQDA